MKFDGGSDGGSNGGAQGEEEDGGGRALDAAAEMEAAMKQLLSERARQYEADKAVSAGWSRLLWNVYRSCVIMHACVFGGRRLAAAGVGRGGGVDRVSRHVSLCAGCLPACNTHAHIHTHAPST
jgi:hypothetical protein